MDELFMEMLEDYKTFQEAIDNLIDKLKDESEE